MQAKHHLLPPLLLLLLLSFVQKLDLPIHGPHAPPLLLLLLLAATMVTLSVTRPWAVRWRLRAW
jgi:hypothetical protein